jgi:hypothetical protein
MLAEEVVDEPDTGGAGEIAEAQGEARRGIGRGSFRLGHGDRFGDFLELVAGGLELGGGLENASSEQLVKGSESARLDEIVDDPAAGAAEFLGLEARLESVAAMVAAAFLEGGGLGQCGVCQDGAHVGIW